MENLTDIGVIKDILSRHGFTFSKSLGQNFLVNPTVCPRIAEMGNAKSGFGVIEIGTGVGVLTHELAKRSDKVVAVEIDERLIPVLEETLAEHDNLKIINADVMKLDLRKVTSPVIMMLLESRLRVKTITVMVQKEAGVRLCAKMGTRDVGAVTAAVRYYSEPEMLFNVSRGSFMPPPNVDSCVIRLNVFSESPYNVSDEEFFFKVVRGAFSQRRKNLLNSLSSSLGIEKSVVVRAVEKVGLSSNVRPEQLMMEDFIKVSEYLKKEVHIR